MTSLLDRDRVWAAIDAQRLRVAALLEELNDDEWRQPSLCEGWTVRDVAAHLTMQQLTLGDLLGLVARYRTDLNRATHDRAKLPTAQLIARIRAMVGSRRHNVGVTYRESLIDALVHGQDIAIPLGRTLDIPPEAAAEATHRMWTMRFPPKFPATRAMRGFRLVATDIDWSIGDGPEVHGPAGALMLVACGRLIALSQLSGPGAASLANRLRRTEPTSISST